MSLPPCTEDTLVQQTTAEYLEERLGRESVYAHNHEDFGPDSLLGRASDREVVVPDQSAGKRRVAEAAPVEDIDLHLRLARETLRRGARRFRERLRQPNEFIGNHCAPPCPNRGNLFVEIFRLLHSMECIRPDNQPDPGEPVKERRA